MHSSTSPLPLTRSVPASTRERLLDAAAEVFARDGLAAATTREIARAAGVNEVTLFRLFRTKHNLLAMVLERVFSPPPPPPAVSEGETAETCVTKIIQEYAANYSARLGRNFALVRVLVGEIQHFQEHELQVMRGIFRPERQRLIDRLRAAQEAGLVRRELNPEIIADQVGAIIFMGALKSSMPTPPEYGAQSYLQACVETIVRAIEVPPPAAPQSAPFD